MSLFRKKEMRHSPTPAEATAEAAAFRAESQSLRAEMTTLRGVMSSTSERLDAFARTMKEAAG